MASKLKKALEKLFDKAKRGPTYTGSLYPQGTKPVQNIKTGMGGPLMQRDYGGSAPPAAASAQAGPVSPAAAMPAVAAAALRARPPAPPVPPEAQAQVRVPNFGHELPPGMTGEALPGVEAGVGVGDDVMAQFTDRPNAQPVHVKSPGVMRMGAGAVPGPHMDDVGFHDEELEPVVPLGEVDKELPYETMLTEQQPDPAMTDRLVHEVVTNPQLQQMLIRMLRSRGAGEGGIPSSY